MNNLKVEWQSEITSKVGHGVPARNYLRHLISKGAEIRFDQDESYLAPFVRSEDPYWENLMEKNKNIDAPIRMCFTLPIRYRENPGKITIGHLMWETTKIPRQWVDPINTSCPYLIVPSKDAKEIALDSGIMSEVLVCPPTIDTDKWNPEGPQMDFNEASKDHVRFMTVANLIPRKNLEKLILGFCIAFEDVKDVTLIIKSWAGDDSAKNKKHISDAVKFIYGKVTGMKRKPQIIVVTDMMEEEQMINMFRSIDCYIAISKGEGIDNSTMQAMSMGKLVVGTPFLGRKDLLKEDNSIPIKYTLTPCFDAATPFYDSYQMWSEPDMDHYITSLRLAYSGVRSGVANVFGLKARKDMIKLDKKCNLYNTLLNITEGKYVKKTPAVKQSIKDLLK